MNLLNKSCSAYIFLLLHLSHCSVVICLQWLPYQTVVSSLECFVSTGHSTEFSKCLIKWIIQLNCKPLKSRHHVFLIFLSPTMITHIDIHHDALSLEENLIFTSSTWSQQKQFKCQLCFYEKSLSYVLRLISTLDWWEQTYGRTEDLNEDG